MTHVIPLGPPHRRATRTSIPIRLNRLVAVLLSLVFFGALLYEMACGIAGSAVGLDFGVGGTMTVGTLRLSNVKYDQDQRAITAKVDIELVAARPDAEMVDAVFTLAPNPDGSIDWTPSSRCSRVDGESAPQPDRQPTPSVQLSCGEQVLLTLDPAAERRYPFDSYRIALRPQGCVNANDCTNMRNIEFARIDVVVSDRQLTPEGSTNGGGGIFTLQRPFVVRVVSVAFVVIAIVVLVNLLAISSRTEVFGGSLGFFATVWGLRTLLVPESVTAFPTAVDYTVLGLCCAVFSIVLWRLVQE